MCYYFLISKISLWIIICFGRFMYVFIYNFVVCPYSSNFLMYNSMLLEFPKMFPVSQAVCRHLLTAEAWVQSQASPCENYYGQRGSGTGFSSARRFFPCQ